MENMNQSFYEACKDLEVLPGSYNIGFINADGADDETQLELAPGEDFTDLYNIWKEFANENDLADQFDVTYIEHAGF